MAKKKIFVLEHKDSLHREEVTEDFYNNELQDSIKEKYNIKSQKDAPDTPSEAIDKK